MYRIIPNQKSLVEGDRKTLPIQNCCRDLKGSRQIFHIAQDREPVSRWIDSLMH